MARIRTIKPSFFKNEELADLPMTARLLFIGLWTIADREGRLEDRYKRIKAEVFPYDTVDIDSLLSRLQSAGFIMRYEVGELKVIQIINFSKHQRVSGTEATTPSELPPYEKGSTLEAVRKQSGSSLEALERSIGKERKKEEGPPTLQEVREFVTNKGFPVSLADKVFEYYDTANWKDSKGNKVKNWKQKLIAVWLKDEHKIQTTGISKTLAAIKASTSGT